MITINENSYIIFALIASISFAVSQILNKLLSKHSIDNSDSLFTYFMIASFTFGLVLIPFVDFTFPTIAMLKYLLGATSLLILGFYFFYKGIFTADATTFSPLFMLQAGMIGILAYVFLGERFPLSNYLWLILLIFGTLLVSFQEKMTIKKFFSRGVVFILLMQVVHSISNIFVGFSLRTISPIQLLFYEYMIVGIFAVFYILIKKPKMNYNFKQVSPMFLSTFITGIGGISLFQAFTQNLTVSSVIASLSSSIVFVFSILASSFAPQLLEHHTYKVYIIRGIGLVIILIGAAGITLSK